MIVRRLHFFLFHGIILLFALLECVYSAGPGQVIWAVNCGGDEHVDSFGISYEKDPLHGRIGIASDYGTRLIIGRVPPNDYILYQTERYHTNTFGYDIPANVDGEYVLVLKFCEVYFNAPDQKVFDVVINADHTVIADLDIFARVGRGIAHDEYVPYKISKGRLYVNGEESEIRGGRMRVEFIKSYKDNPKINAIYVLRGQLEDVPKLPPIPSATDTLSDETERDIDDLPPKIKPAGPLEADPYTMEESSLLLPVFIAIGAFIPVLFCLCKL